MIISLFRDVASAHLVNFGTFSSGPNLAFPCRKPGVHRRRPNYLLLLLVPVDKIARILLTGGAGFIGAHLAAHLIDRGTAVTLLLREAHREHRQLPARLAALRPHFEVVYADLRHYDLTVRAIREAAPVQVVHLAAAGVTDPFVDVDTAVRHNVTGTLNLVRACFEENGITRQLLVARTPGEATAMNVYAASKAAAWSFCRMYGRTHAWPIQGAMIYQAYGPGQPAGNVLPGALAAALAGEAFPMTAGRQERDWIYVEDVAAGLAAALRADLAPGVTVELGTGRATAVAAVVQQLFELVNRGGRPLIGALPARPGEVARQVANTALTRERTGWQATTPLDEGLRRLVAAAKYSSGGRTA
jgi:UDP-glucose 4-epimerase